jgi:hypothetical protein
VGDARATSTMSTVNWKGAAERAVLLRAVKLEPKPDGKSCIPGRSGICLYCAIAASSPPMLAEMIVFSYVATRHCIIGHRPAPPAAAMQRAPRAAAHTTVHIVPKY